MATGTRAAILGAGTTSRFGKLPERTRTGLAAEALSNAIADAGLEPDELDGLVTNMGVPLARNYDRLCEELGLSLEFVDQKWSHGRWVGPSVQHAAMAIEAGLAEYVAVGVGLKFNVNDQVSGDERTGLSDLGGISQHAVRPWYGMFAPAGASALATRYYMEKYGATSEDLGHVAVTMRRHASMNPTAHYSDPIDLDDHQSSRWIVEPLRLFDCAPVSDGGAYLVLTSEENARESTDRPVSVAAISGVHAGPEEFPFARPGMGIRSQREAEYEPGTRVADLYARAGVERSDVDGLYTYDAFAPNVWYALERWGFCEPGEAYGFTRDGNIGIGGTLPVNTNGGILSDGHISAWNHVVEMYDQLLGRCGPRQIADAETLQWATTFGDSFVLRRAR